MEWRLILTDQTLEMYDMSHGATLIYLLSIFNPFFSIQSQSYLNLLRPLVLRSTFSSLLFDHHVELSCFTSLRDEMDPCLRHSIITV